jgi:hypothetical protein
VRSALSLFGSYQPRERPLAARPLVVHLTAPRPVRDVASLRLVSKAKITAEALCVEAPAIARWGLRGAALRCRVLFADATGAPWQIDVAWRPSLRLARALTELSGTMHGVADGPAYDVRLRLNWR